MCGIVGIWDNQGTIQGLEHEIERMKKSIAHRGPDANGTWISNNGKIAFGHQRLSIIDLSDNAAQPMNKDGYIITFNGEIYNYIELKRKLQNLGVNFSSESDTEVLLKGYQHFGTKILDYLDGMFAFAIYDPKSEQLFCARDRFGEKPFYYTIYNNKLYFGSELKAFWSIDLPKEPNYKQWYNYLAFDLIENPNDQSETFYKNCFKLKPGHYFQYDGKAFIIQKNYWSLNTETTNDLSFEEASIKLKELLTNSVNLRLRSDVEVGTSLSGGLDSSSIVALVSKEIPNCHTVSARFNNFSKDEGKYIQLVQQKFNTNHFNCFVSESDFLTDLDKIIYHQEEPLLSGSVYAQYQVYKTANENGIKVMLDGQGADELLAGYDKDIQFYFRELLGNSEKLNQYNMEAKMGNINDLWKINIDRKTRFKVNNPTLSSFAGKVKWKFNTLNTGLNVSFSKEYKPKTSPFHEFNDLKSTLKHELINQGLEKLLKLADRNSMAHGVEVRLPFLSHDLVEFVLSLKSDHFLKNGWTKSILRNAMKDELPSEIVYRKDKIGFEAPHNLWIQSTNLKEQIREAKNKLMKDNIINPNYSNDWKMLMMYKSLHS